jgi:hypothetical protein
MLLWTRKNEAAGFEYAIRIFAQFKTEYYTRIVLSASTVFKLKVVGISGTCIISYVAPLANPSVWRAMCRQANKSGRKKLLKSVYWKIKCGNMFNRIREANGVGSTLLDYRPKTAFAHASQ